MKGFEGSFASRSAAIQSIVATPDGRRLVGGGIEGNLHVLDVDSSTYLVSIPVRDVGALQDVAVDDNGRGFAGLANQACCAWRTGGAPEVCNSSMVSKKA